MPKLSVKRIRARRQAHRISVTEVAKRIGVSRVWLEQIDSGRYCGPCVQDYAERISNAIDEIVAERKQSV